MHTILNYNSKQCIINKMDQHPHNHNDHLPQPDISKRWESTQTHHQFKQFPLIFAHPPIDKISKSLTAFGIIHQYRIVYMGPRYASNYKAFKAFAKRDKLQGPQQQNESYGESFTKYGFQFGKERQKPFPLRLVEYRLFTGMNPTVHKDDLRFDSNFECGNLDLAICVSPVEYDLIMRVDSNTKGHTSWFYFKVSNFSSRQKIKFNLINFQKGDLLYNIGQKPYILRSSTKMWEQANTEVEFKSKNFRYYQQNSTEAVTQKCLSFSFGFSEQDQSVYFAYCVPYSYSYLLSQVNKLEKQYPQFVTVQRNNYSTGGLLIPILTITNKQSTEIKQVLLAIGRLHPGQTQGSWTIDGFLKYLCSQKAQYLRQKLICKIIPMVNVDGVVLGNFRTSIQGRDLNRVFNQPKQYKQVNMVRKIAQTTNPLIFLDFHGHSTKKNVFTYGPNYPIDHKHYLASRIFPKIVSKITNAFRYYSCIFKISECKINTARSLLLRQHRVTFTFTVEASAYAYGSKNGLTEFNSGEYGQLGKNIGQGLSSFLKIICKMPKRTDMSRSICQKRSKDIDEKEESFQNNLQSKNAKAKVQKRYTNTEEFTQNEVMSELIQELNKAQESAKNAMSTMKTCRTNEGEYEDSDFQQGCDYTEKELQKIMKLQDMIHEVPIMPKQKSKKIRSKRQQVITDGAQLTAKIKKQRHFIREISEQPTTKIISPIKQITRRKIKQLSIQSISPQIINVKSLKLQSHKSFTHLQSTPAPVNVMNPIHWINWRKKNSQHPQKADHINFINVKSLNNINLDYQQEKKEQQIQAELPKKKKYENWRRRFKIERQRDEGKQRERSSKRQQALHVKQSLLPILNKNNVSQRKSNVSLLDELLEHNERIYKNYGGKNVKIVYN